MNNPIYIFAGGGTGGHLFPALAVADELTRLMPDCRIVFACSDRDIDRRVLSATPYAFVVQPIHSMPRGLRGWRDFTFAFHAGRRLADNLLKDLRPAAVFGLGAFAAVPVTQAAANAGVRTALMSIDATPGFANRRLARKVDVIFTQFEQTSDAFGRFASKVEPVGCPVRTGLIAGDIEQARKVFGLRRDRKTLLIMAGSLGAESINQAVAEIGADLDGLADVWQILHVSGPGKFEQVARADNEAIHRSVMEFCERMDLAYSVADLVLCRAGAATVGELAAVAAPAVLMPYPYHRDRQQARNAAGMVSSGAAVLVDDAADPPANADALRASLLEIMRRQERLDAMRESAKGLSRPGAAEQIARWLSGPIKT
ncbi:MAG: UDP-N-acetylglucosamine--N-acetylmuramyl-(pentapeptide) pyrophosphoryl-undecaprenol N-acetylglucosamine transferase [Phycisphaerae bacterium]|nr:UDP-N-acetylglucosamine--N-acetylmuramyl-(pentapeptide) pyrophosphoryl-undecaprenol N-acetylglucosamine transferase [Phycisphaerae bacterium]